MNNYDKNMKEIEATVQSDHVFHLSSPSKVSLKSKCSFGLPAGPAFSCPKATRACKNCYAKKGRFAFKTVSKALMKNWKLVKEYEAQNKFERMVKKLSKSIPNNSTIFRIHTVGDFYSQFYLDVWTEIIRQNPKISFWAYTRSFDLNFQRIVRLPNYNMFVSTDQYNKQEAEGFVQRYAKSHIRFAYGPCAHDVTLPDGAVICPVTNKTLKSDGACEKCKICIKKEGKNVVFLKH